MDFTSSEEAKDVLEDADAVLVNLYPLDGELIRSMKKCRVISRYGVGYDNVDVDAATEMGIQVCRVPDYSVEDVSDHALALLLGCVRMTAYKDRMIRTGKWNLHSDYPCFRMKDRVLGIVGYGLIGRALHRKVSGFGFWKVLVYDPYADQEEIKKRGGTPVDMKCLLGDSDYISIHAPLSGETKHLFDESAFDKMRQGTILVNTSRGGLIDEQALCDALDRGILASAGLDVFESEPLELESKLRRFDNVILTDHTGFYSVESLRELKIKAAENIVEVLRGDPPTYPVNSVKSK